jgi:hypothetical protein
MDTDRLTKAEHAEYDKRINSFIRHNLVSSKDEMGRSCWEFKGRPDIASRLQELHLETMVEILDNRLR